MILLGVTAILGPTFNLSTAIKFQNFIKEGVNAHVNETPSNDPKAIQSKPWQRQMQEIIQQIYPHLMPEEVTELVDSTKNVMMLAVTLNPNYTDRLVNFSGTFSIILPNISLIIPSEP
jgi:hypothetical protein